MDNSSQFVGRLFVTLCGPVGFGHFATNAYHLHTNGQAEPFQKNGGIPTLNNLAEFQHSGDQFVYSFTYAFNTQVHQATKINPYSLELNRKNFGTSLLYINSQVSTDTHGETSD